MLFWFLDSIDIITNFNILHIDTRDERFMYLRDIVVSYSYFLAKQKELPEYKVFGSLKSSKERYLTLIKGYQLSQTIHAPDIGKWFRLFQGWFYDPNTLSIMYEDLVHSKKSREKICSKILDFLLEDQINRDTKKKWIELMEQGANPKLSSTYRTGKIGSWKTEFDDEVKKAFKEKAGDILIETGYEKNFNW